ncbi:MAG: phosphoribosylamine--glycine ligase, partial [Anaerolineae bacterium]|nr:phosphoribosylamine--glycine ligase [Anaerolineae bacterium]
MHYALDYMMNRHITDFVIKADGLARGKGVFIPRGESDAEGILRALFERDALGQAGRRVIIEQKVTGTEIAVKAFTDGATVAMMPPVTDYKRLRDHDEGPNTGGMGACTPTLSDPGLLDGLRTRIIEPVLAGLHADSCAFKGVFYADVILTPDQGPLALGLNARWGDPGAQTVLPLLETDLLAILEACIDDRLAELDVQWREGFAASVVMATAGYPYHSDPGLPITQSDYLPEDALLFHAGTRRAADGTLITTGGRVVTLTATGPNLPTAITRVYDSVRQIHFTDAHFRTDIGAQTG